MSTYIQRVDDKGRIVIPRNIRKTLKIGKAVKLYVQDGKLIVEPMEDPLERASKIVTKVSIKASVEPEKISEIASSQLIQET